MRQGFVHHAVLVMAADADLRAVGARVTTELCGSWPHEPPCPLAPHQTRADRAGDEVRARILFVAEPDRETEVRRRIDLALASGRLDHPQDGVTVWAYVSSGPAPLTAEETAHAQRLTRG